VISQRVNAVQIERLRKEGSRLVAEEQEKLQQQLREEASQLYCNADTGVRLRVSKLHVTSVRCRDVTMTS